MDSWCPELATLAYFQACCFRESSQELALSELSVELALLEFLLEPELLESFSGVGLVGVASGVVVPGVAVPGVGAAVPGVGAAVPGVGFAVPGCAVPGVGVDPGVVAVPGGCPAVWSAATIIPSWPRRAVGPWLDGEALHWSATLVAPVTMNCFAVPPLAEAVELVWPPALELEFSLPVLELVPAAAAPSFPVTWTSLPTIVRTLSKFPVSL